MKVKVEYNNKLVTVNIPDSELEKLANEQKTGYERKKVDDVPTEDAKLVAHAHWICQNPNFPLMGRMLYTCSRCGRGESVDMDKKIVEVCPYCHCGAKMDEEVPYECS